MVQARPTCTAVGPPPPSVAGPWYCGRAAPAAAAAATAAPAAAAGVGLPAALLACGRLLRPSWFARDASRGVDRAEALRDAGPGIGGIGAPRVPQWAGAGAVPRPRAPRPRARRGGGLGVFLHTVPSSRFYHSVIRFSRTMYARFRIPAAAIPRTSPPRIRRFVRARCRDHLFDEKFDKIWKPSRVCIVSLGRRKSRTLKPLAFDE
jgi:hypothetical protein